MIYDCVTGDQPCVPFDANVSLDGKRKLCLPSTAQTRSSIKITGLHVPIRSLSKSGNKSELLEYDLRTGSIAALKYTEGNQRRPGFTCRVTS